MLELLTFGQWIVVWLGVWAVVSAILYVIVVRMDGKNYAAMAIPGCMMFGAMVTAVLFSVFILVNCLVFLWNI